MLGLDGIQRASSSGIGSKASARGSRLTTIGLSRRFLAGSNAAADNYRIGNARSSFHGGLSRTRVRLPPPPQNLSVLQSVTCGVSLGIVQQTYNEPAYNTAGRRLLTVLSVYTRHS